MPSATAALILPAPVSTLFLNSLGSSLRRPAKYASSSAEPRRERGVRLARGVVAPLLAPAERSSSLCLVSSTRLRISEGGGVCKTNGPRQAHQFVRLTTRVSRLGWSVLTPSMTQEGSTTTLPWHRRRDAHWSWLAMDLRICLSLMELQVSALQGLAAATRWT
ncbi:uncharacterized protein B0I36DRAFT_141528 [Microdochium trichocladiopsis]|uniref:Uncharacterized protein n=1 Tax=Microdochium trichocladiopsis TaxID=1682393 RepID=A0A9P9BRU9_9PEZI|nr:uncharacterized protein B0I36DRAFT_141528 [Microdochium trichocladiopsis]KAH7027655.1 hypothetical protein B0I36DRAFT_141528 [Microdochium trichocladiopsis]